jgi:hypothetical protein
MRWQRWGLARYWFLSHNDTFDCFCRPHDDDDDALTGVTDISTDVAAKTVIVQADPSVKPEDMLEKLQKARFLLTLRPLSLHFLTRLPLLLLLSVAHPFGCISIWVSDSLVVVGSTKTQNASDHHHTPQNYYIESGVKVPASR